MGAGLLRGHAHLLGSTKGHGANIGVVKTHFCHGRLARCVDLLHGEGDLHFENLG